MLHSGHTGFEKSPTEGIKKKLKRLIDNQREKKDNHPTENSHHSPESNTVIIDYIKKYFGPEGIPALR